MGVDASSIKEPVVWVFVAGATGAIGRQLVPRLAAAGREVHEMTRSEWKQAMLGAEQPVRAPRLAAGEAGAVLMTDARGACNAKANRGLGWQPRHPSWRQGLTAA
jgi:nucleoside-diphosphate-sugar epimerase